MVFHGILICTFWYLLILGVFLHSNWSFTYLLLWNIISKNFPIFDRNFFLSLTAVVHFMFLIQVRWYTYISKWLYIDITNTILHIDEYISHQTHNTVFSYSLRFNFHFLIYVVQRTDTFYFKSNLCYIFFNVCVIPKKFCLFNVSKCSDTFVLYVSF